MSFPSTSSQIIHLGEVVCREYQKNMLQRECYLLRFQLFVQKHSGVVEHYYILKC